MKKKPDWTVFYDYFQRQMRGENPKHLYDGYDPSIVTAPPSRPPAAFVSPNAMIAERARADMEYTLNKKPLEKAEQKAEQKTGQVPGILDMWVNGLRKK